MRSSLCNSILVAILVLSLFPFLAFGQEKAKNYVSTQRYVSSADTIHTIEYLDGLGRSKQTVKKGYTPQGNDLVTMTEYDAYGNESKQWLPIVFPCTGKAIDENIFCNEAFAYYKNKAPYQEQDYESSSFPTELKVYEPGGKFCGSGKYKQYSTRPNSQFMVGFQLGQDRKSITYGKRYLPGELDMSIECDEDGHAITRYTDMFGNIVMEKRAGEKTFFVYDSCGNLIFVLPPMATQGLSKSGTIYSISSDALLQQYAYYYRYDDKNKCVEMKRPGCAPMLMIYDNDGKLTFVQDGNLRKKKEWSFTLYDKWHRIVVMGICKGNASLMNELAYKSVEATQTKGGDLGGYACNLPLDIVQLLKVVYYDDYTYLDSSLKSSYGYQKVDSVLCTEESSSKVTAKGKMTGTRTYILGDASRSFLKSYYYDQQGNMIQTHGSNQLSGLDDEYYTYDYYTHKIKSRRHEQLWIQDILGTQPEVNTNSITYSYDYDKQGRLDSIWCKINKNRLGKFLIASYRYDELGRIDEEGMGNSALNTHYKYDLRSRVTQKSNGLTEQNVYYDINHGVSGISNSYNGNVHCYEWKRKDKVGNWQTESYTYEYNNRNWLVGAYSLSTDASGKTVSGLHDVNIEYDAMGNITHIARKGVNEDDGTEGYRDDASLSYDGNQLSGILNQGFTDSSFDDAIETQSFGTNKPYTYDENGNRTRDLNKGILRIDYNVLNLPEYIYLGDGSYEHITYDADGRKLEAITGTSSYNVTVPEMGILTTNIDSLKIRAGLINQSSRMVYTDDFIYNNSYHKQTMNGIFPALGIDHVQLPNGYVKHIGDKELMLLNQYVTDYLGNNRLVVNSNEIVQANNFYPYGGIWDKKASANSQLWKFGGKELDSNTNIYSWVFRNYEPTTGGFFTPDPLAVMNYSMSPYTFAFNNPINYMELLGLRGYKVGEVNRDFDPRKDTIELPDVVCTGKAQITLVSVLDEGSLWTGRIKDAHEGLKGLDKVVPTDTKSHLLWEAKKKVQKYSPYLAAKLKLSQFHPSKIYKGVTRTLKETEKYARRCGAMSRRMNEIRIAVTGEIDASMGIDATIMGAGYLIPGYGWAIDGTYLVTDMLVEGVTGKTIGEHFDDYVREEYGSDTINVYDCLSNGK